jgi:hypothetical protein
MSGVERRAGECPRCSSSAPSRSAGVRRGRGTRVEVVHTGWERVGPDFRERMAGYQEGWGTVLDAFAEAAGGGI